MSDQDERAWWVFQLPEAFAYVPATTEADARKALERDAYKGAPVASWPCVGSRFTSRELLSAELLRRAAGEAVAFAPLPADGRAFQCFREMLDAADAEMAKALLGAKP